MTTPRRAGPVRPDGPVRLERLWDTARVGLPRAARSARGGSFPASLRDGYDGELDIPLHPDRPTVVANFVSTLDGVVAFDVDGSSGGEVSGFFDPDRFVMGLLRAMADAVVVGAGTLRAVPRHLWTAQYIYPPLAAAYTALRVALGKPPAPLTVVVSGAGAVDTTLPVFQQVDGAALLLTTPGGAAALPGPGGRALGPQARVQTISPLPDGSLAASVALDATLAALAALSGLARSGGARQPLVLVEGGPRLLTRFVAERLLDEQFLTVAPQLVGRDDQFHRPGLIEGQRLAPGDPRWARLVSVRRAESFLFLRYRLR